MHKPRIWVLPGMGSDSRIFKHLQFPWPATFLEWIAHREGEDLSAYAERLLRPYPIAEQDLLLGYSLGGIVAQDWASKHRVQRVIVINSLHYSLEVRPLFHRLAKTGVLEWSSPESLRKLIFFMARLNSTPSEELENYLEMMEQFPPEHYTWVLKNVLDWKRPTPLCPVESFTGTLDLVFPHLPADLPFNHLLKNATHLSLITHSEEISRVLKVEVDPLLN